MYGMKASRNTCTVAINGSKLQCILQPGPCSEKGNETSTWCTCFIYPSLYLVHCKFLIKCIHNVW